MKIFFLSQYMQIFKFTLIIIKSMSSQACHWSVCTFVIRHSVSPQTNEQRFMFIDWAVINGSWTEGLCDVLMTAVSQMNNCQCFPSVSSGLWWRRLWQQVKTLFSSLLLNVSVILPPSFCLCSVSVWAQARLVLCECWRVFRGRTRSSDHDTQALQTVSGHTGRTACFNVWVDCTSLCVWDSLSLISYWYCIL